MKNFYRTKGFTVAEIITTIAILGIISVITISFTLNRYKEKETVVKVKKAYNTISKAFSQAEIVNGPINYWDIGPNGAYIDGAEKLWI